MTSYNLNARGAEWHKWDLHVHTPASFHWLGGKQFSQMNTSEKDANLQEMYSAIEQSDVAAFAIMDYWTFDGYLDFMQYLDDTKLKLNKTVFPGMELRIEAPVDYRLNIQVVLSDKHSKQELQDFKSNLIIGSLKRQLSSEALKMFAKTLDESKAKTHGFSKPDQLSEDGLLKLGSMTAEITKESLENAMNVVRAKGAFIIMPYDTSDGLEGLDWKKHPHADNYFMQSADIFESRDNDTIALFTCKITEKNKSYIENFQKTLGNKRKPVICGSDAHKFTDYGVYPSKRATWIKSDPSFEGLRQILFEPTDRICIQENRPGKQLNYLIIDRISFKDDIFKRFTVDSILLNDNLNVVIGGKSSGKSLLLHHIAKTIDRKQVEQKNELLSSSGYDFESDDGFDFEVVWRDGSKASLKDGSGSDGRQVTYIPQMFINHLAEEKGEQQLKNLIDQILEQNIDYQVFLEGGKAAIQESNAQISQLLGVLINLRETNNTTIHEIKEIGDKKAIEAQVDEILRKIDLLTQASGFSAEETEEYEKLMALKMSHDDKISRFNSIKETLESYSSQTTGYIQEIAESNFEEFTTEFQQHLQNDKLGARLFDRLTTRKKALLLTFLADYEKVDTDLSSIVNAKVEKHKLLRDQYSAQLAPFLAKVTNQEQLKELQKLVSSEQDKIIKIAEKEKKQNEISEREKNTKKQLFEKYAALHQGYLSIVNKLAQPPFNKITSDLELKAQLAFDVNRFDQTFCALFDRRSNFDAAFGSYFKNNQYSYNRAQHEANIDQIFNKLSQLNLIGLRLKNERTVRDAAQSLIGDYFGIKYTVTQGKDDITKMSPGKRGLVLLQLILHLSNASHPILIDQPEDNLDNRTVYAELNQFIKEKKLQRQIIFATHNANLVVSTDAENVIVANQAGQVAGKDNRQFPFEYVTGSLEFSFRDDAASGILYQMGIREHVCEILEGGQAAFEKREQKYGFK